MRSAIQKQAATGNISGLSILGNQPVMDEVDWQTQRKLEVIARDIEYLPEWDI